ncbi:PorP/SprF family type IX secretion system membrane protein [Flavilitoribacter nigricans]|uniref:Type IX secretion system membrane protein PorP/SprF n=1 Tax=Flavilitoribacter nigricans (strain ATCC 23147 / DSM 23189 / NBRC 102662 / NCIMB 1420 / SS-2) TaxID=1122177 RepID=A0A2D0N9A4_FLAN2|nr:PorP/SprF family type IX secretion system membrane protein [Flavilitoribacter nigricans]PHN04950.1 hypothetical protein CRP01_18130 [Flavilitoribacter nigricans DSM 23189 = NBRC 102662]
MIRYFLLPILLLISLSVSAQQLPLFTQYRENATIINPAAMESDFFAYGNNVTLGASYRAQWVGISGSPRTQTIRGSFLSMGGAGVNLTAGGYLINDVTGPTGFTGFYGRVGGVLGADPEYSGLAIGISGGMVQYRIDANKVNVRDVGDPVAAQDNSQLFPDLGVGIYFYNTVGDNNYFYVGASAPQLFGLNLLFEDENGDFSVERIRHYYAQLGYYIFFDNDSFVELSSWGKYVQGAPFNIDFNIRYQLPTALWIGTGMGKGSTSTGPKSTNFHIDAGVVLGEAAGFDSTIRFGYGFDYSFSSFGPTAGSTHEVNLTYSFSR